MLVDIEEITRDGVRLLGRVAQGQFVQNAKHAFTIYEGVDWAALKDKLPQGSQPLGSFTTISRGEEYGKKRLTKLGVDVPSGKVPILVGQDISRYSPAVPSRAIDETLLRKDKMKYRSPKIVIVKTGHRLACTLDFENQYTLQSIYNICFAEDARLSAKYVLGVLNSSLMSAHVWKEVTAYKKLFPQLNQRHVEGLPIRRIDFDDPEERQMHDGLVALVERMLDLNKRLAEKGKLRDSEYEDIERESARTDAEINALVYDLYGLTDAERRLVEDAVRR